MNSVANYTQKDQDAAIDAMKKGMLIVDVAKLVPIPISTLYAWSADLTKGRRIAKISTRGSFTPAEVKCPFCPRTFRSPQGLWGHSRIHLNAQAYTEKPANTERIQKPKTPERTEVHTINPEIIENAVFSLLEKGHKYDALLLERDRLLKENEALHNDLHALRKMHEKSLASKLEQANIGITMPKTEG